MMITHTWETGVDYLIGAYLFYCRYVRTRFLYVGYFCVYKEAYRDSPKKKRKPIGSGASL